MAGPDRIPGRWTRKKCLPPPRRRGRMTLRRLADGRPAAQRPQPTNKTMQPSRVYVRRNGCVFLSRPVDRHRSWANPSTAENSVGRSFPPRRRWLRSDVRYRISVAGLVRRAGRSRLDGRSRQRAGSSGLRWCALKGQGQISPGQSVAPPRVVVANGSGSPEGARQADASIVSPLQGFFAAIDTLPRATATLAQLASPCPGLICRAPSGQRRPKRKKNVRFLARNRVVTAMAGPDRIPGRWTRKKKCLPPPRRRGRMTLRRLADGRPAAQRPQHPRTKRCNRAAFTSGGMDASSCRGRLIAIVI
jgi:hypothetical protein